TVFFFQAEDGIRDATVTGVQTCALPISYNFFQNVFASFFAAPVIYVRLCCNRGHHLIFRQEFANELLLFHTHQFQILDTIQEYEIGRASCRERVYIYYGGVWLKVYSRDD